MPHNKIAPVLLGTILAASLAPAGATAADEHMAKTEAPVISPDTDNNTDVLENVAEKLAHDTPVTGQTEQATTFIVRDGERLPFDNLTGAVEAAQNGDVIELTHDQVLDKKLVIAGGLKLTLRATSNVTITRSDSFTTQDGKPAGMILVEGGSQLTLEGTDNNLLTLHGENKDSNEAIITLRNSSTLTMRKGSVINQAHCSWKPWGAVYVHSGTFTLDGGEIRNGFAMHNAAVAVEPAGTFEMHDGVISSNRATYSETIVWTKGTVRMTGGSIMDNRSNVSSDAVVRVLAGGSFAFEGGTIGDNKPNNTFGMHVEAGGSLTIGTGARFEGTDRINLTAGARLHFTGAPTAHNTKDPVEVVLSGAWDHGTTVATTTSPAVAQDVLTRLSVKRGGASEHMASVGVDAANTGSIALASPDVAEAFEMLDNPFADQLGLTLKSELSDPDAFERLRETVEQRFNGIETPEKQVRLQQIEHLKRYIPYHQNHIKAIKSSVIELSELGNPGSEAQRTQQGYQFDNLDATGLYLKPGQINEIVVYIEAQDPSKLSVAWRKAGVTTSNEYTALNLHQQSKLANGANRITVDLTGNNHGSMLYLRNDSTSNPARVRIEAADAPYVESGSTNSTDEDGSATRGGSTTSTNPLLGTSLEAHPLYEHDPGHPERFWTFVQDVKAHAERVQTDGVSDMALLQMGDDGHAQFSLRATVLAEAYQHITSKQQAVEYIERSNEAIQDRLELFWTFDGYNTNKAGGPNAVTTARVHTAFTSTVTRPSTMYAYMRYYHMPESHAASFLSGENMYSWGMSHEYGHMLDNNIISVGEETNNLYSLAGSRQGGIERLKATGKAFVPKEHYHENAVKATERRDEELARMAADPSYEPDWMNNNNWGTYIWTHLVAWWNGLHFFDDWDYSTYNFDASPYTQEIADDVERYGAYGASVRILRSNPEAVETVKQLASGAAATSDKAVKYNRIAVAFTMGTGYNFAEYLYELGERDLTEEVLEYCAQYPSMPRAVRYFSLDTDAAIINGAQTYAELEGAANKVAPSVTVEQTENGRVHVTATMATEDLARATTAYELYRDGELIGFSRDGSFDVAAPEGADSSGNPGAHATAEASSENMGDTAVETDGLAAYTVVAYDVRLNPSRAANLNGPVFDEELPDDENGELPDDENAGNGGDNGAGDEGSEGDNNPGGEGSDDDDTDSDGDDDNQGKPDDDDNSDDTEKPGEDTGSGGSGDDENKPDNDPEVPSTPDDEGGSEQPDGGTDDEQPETGTPGTGENPPTGNDGVGDDSTSTGEGTGEPNGGSRPEGTTPNKDVAGGSAENTSPNGSSAAGGITGALAQTGDTSLVLAIIVAGGSAIAFLGAAIARRFRKT